MSASLYTREMYDKFKLHAAWPPNSLIRLGDVGAMEEGERFVYRTSLEEQEIPFHEDAPGGPASYEHATDGAVSFTFKGQGQAPMAGSALSEANAGITVGFSRENAVYFRADGTVLLRISNQAQMEQRILDAYERGVWDPAWMVVVEVVRASACTVLISGSRSSTIELETAGAIGTSGFSFADMTAGISIRSQREMSTQVIAATEVTPLLRVRRLRWKFLRGIGLEGANPESQAFEDWEAESSQ